MSKKQKEATVPDTTDAAEPQDYTFHLFHQEAGEHIANVRGTTYEAAEAAAFDDAITARGGDRARWVVRNREPQPPETDPVE